MSRAGRYAAVPGVRVYIGWDTSFVTTDADGKFAVKVKRGTTLCFRKRGYRWLNLRVTEKTPSIVHLSQSVKQDLDYSAIYVDGELLPRDEWNDIPFGSDYFIMSQGTGCDGKTYLNIRSK
jgi:hypothetical protein